MDGEVVKIQQRGVTDWTNKFFSIFTGDRQNLEVKRIIRLNKILLQY